MDISRQTYTEAERNKLYKQMFYSKSVDWQYEKEYRDYKALVKGEFNDHYDELGFPIILFEYPIEIIEGVIFGSRVTDDKIIDFMDKIESVNYRIKYERAFIDPEIFKLDILEIKRAL